MSKGSKILLIIWIVLAIASLIGTIYMPFLFWKIVGYSFGVLNMGLILGGALMFSEEKKQEKERVLDNKI